MAEAAEQIDQIDPVPELKVTILGSGGAGGVPTISRGWGACDPDNPKNNRLRASLLVESATTKVLIDTSPDLRQQCLTYGIRELDAVVFTHAHADHVHGLDELREINRVINGPLNVWADATTLRDLETRFGYAFEGLEPDAEIIYKPWLVPNVIDTPAAFRIGDLTFEPFIQDHSVMETLGFRIGDFAYSTDLVRLPDAARDAVAGLDLWLVGALTDIPTHLTHVSFTEALTWIEEIKPKRAVITHMGPSMDYDTLLERCPPGVSLAYDGMVLRV